MKTGTKTHSRYLCQSCGYATPRWLGKCPECGAWNSFIEEMVSSQKKPTARISAAEPQSLSSIPDSTESRTSTGLGEFDRVLGGGLVGGSVVLVGGAPGLGKSTLLLQVGAKLAESGKTVLYISGEESLRQIKMRAERLGVRSERFLLLAETDLESIADAIARTKPDLAVVDSIQTVYSDALESVPGNISQVRFAAHRLTGVAKNEGIPLVLVGHVTKDGSLAGPRVLEHLVDCLILMEGDAHLYRIVRAVKNRFGSTNETGIFEMTEEGMIEVPNPSEHLISERREGASGTVVTVALEGTRPILVEAQALVSPASYGTSQRTATGVDHRRLSILIAVLEKRLGLRMGSQDVFVSSAGGLKLQEPAADLAVAAALVSSFWDKPVHSKTAVFGEIGLTGEIRGVSQAAKRIHEAERLGFDRMVLPASGLKGLSVGRIQLSPVRTIQEAVEALFP